MDQNHLSLAVKEKISKIDLSNLKKYTVIFILFVLMALFSLMKSILSHMAKLNQYHHPEHLLYHRCNWFVICDDWGWD